MAKKTVKNQRKISKKIKKKAIRKKASSKLRPPVISSPDTLPLLDSNFSWEKFERFSKQLIKAIYPEHEVKLFGVKGQKQYGIDLVAQDRDGKHFFAQNKQYKKYSVAQFKKTKSELKLKGSKAILLLSCEASSDLRLEVLGDSLWDIWDINDISDKVFQLENSARKELVKRFFGIEWAKAFSDYNEFSSVVSPIDFFRNYFDPKKLFNHTIPFFSRDNDIEHLRKFTQGTHQALVLNAPGGVGKSRLLWEFSKSSSEPGWSVLFIREGMPPEADHFNNIRSNKVIFIFDDAHRFDPEPYLTFIYALKDIKYKIIFSTRPQGRERLKLALIKKHLESSEIKDYEIKKFTSQGAKELVSKLLPKIDSSYVGPIAKLFTDSTLIGVLACNLIKKKHISLASLSSEEDIKGKVIASFTDELSGKIDSRLSNDFIQKILSHISGFAPISYDEKKIDPKFISATSEKESDVNECIADLLYSGILVERGGRIRISPDVLSDCILENACYLKNNEPSDFFQNSFEKTDNELRNNLLKNISELDWKRKKAELTGSVLLSKFWSKFKDITNDDLSTIYSKLETVKTLAYYQPIESYEVILSTVEYLSKISNDDHDYRFNSCIRYISDICRDVILAGYNIEELMMTLWQLGKNDSRNLNPHPDHPIRRLSDLCSYERNFPIALYEKTLRGLKNIIGIYDSKKDHHEPISMLKGFLAKTSSSTYSEGHNIIISPFHISYENTQKLRLEVFETLKKLALLRDLKTSYLAVKVLSEAATSPRGIVGLEVTEKQSDIWHKEISDTINILIEIYKKTSHSLIKVQVKNNLNHKIRWNKRSRYKSIVSDFLKKNPFSSDELKYVPFAFWSYNDLLVQRNFKDYKKRQDEEQKVYEKITKDIILKLKTPQIILKYTEEVVSELQIISDSVHSWRFSSVLSEVIDNQRMCDALLENGSSKIGHDFGVFLRKISEQDAHIASQYVLKALDLNNIVILPSIAESFWWIFENKETDSTIKDLFEKLFKHESSQIRLSSLIGLKQLLHQNKKSKAIEYMMALNIDSKNIAVALFDLLNPYGIKYDELTESQISKILGKIKDMEDLSDHGIGEFISECANRVPIELFDLLFYRIESKKEHEGQFTAMPYLGFGELSFTLPDDQIIKIFDKIVVALQKENGDTFWLPNLFYEIAKNNHDLSIDYLTDLLKSDDIEAVDTGSILIRKFKNNLVFSRRDWVRELLDHGKNKGTQFFDRIKNCLFLLGIPMEKHGTAGEPMPQDVALVENATEALTQAKSAHEKQFYTELKAYGERMIAMTMKESQRYLDE